MNTDAVYYHGSITNMHNWWMEILTAYGIAVFIGYIAFYINLFVAFKFNYMTAYSIKEKAVSCCLCAIMVGFLISSVSSSSNMTKEWLWMFWAICIGYQGILQMTAIK